MTSDTAFQKADRLGAFFTSLPKWAALAVIAWQARLSIEALTGKGSIAFLLERFGRETSMWELVCWLAGVLGLFFGLYNRYLLQHYRSRKPSQTEPLRRAGEQ